MSEDQVPAQPIDPVEQLRNELRNGRVDKTSRTLDANFGTGDQEARGSVQTLQRESSRDVQSRNTVVNLGGSVAKEPVRIGRPGGRHGTSNRRSAQSDTAIRATTIRRSGGLETDEPIPPRVEYQDHSGEEAGPVEVKRPVGRPPKPETIKAREDAARTEEAKKPIFPWFKENSTLSKEEVKALYDPLCNALIDDFGYVDEYLWHRTGDITQSPIWSDVDREEVESLARIMLRRGERSPAAASMVRAVVNGSDYINAAVIVLPRVIKTADILSKTGKKQKQKRGA